MLWVHSACMPFPMLGCNIVGYDQSYAYDDDKSYEFCLHTEVYWSYKLVYKFCACVNDPYPCIRNDLNKKETWTEFTNKKT